MRRRSLIVSSHVSGGSRVGVDAAPHDQIVVDLCQDERVDEPFGCVPVRLLARLERHELDREAPRSRAGESRRRALGKLLVTATRERVLELVVGQRPLCFVEVALRDEVEVRLAVSVGGELLVDDLPG